MNLVEKEQLYPLLFEPVYKQVMWGGNKLSSVLGRPIPPELEPIGEAWEICDRPEVETLVANGPLEGVSIHQLVTSYGTNLIGGKYRWDRFPLMVKILDVGKRLSLQIHPPQPLCNELRDGSQSKAELWYVIDADPGSVIFAGLKSSVTRRQFIDAVNSPDIENMLQCFETVPGDAYFINAGRIHAAGGGNLFLEIQQNSDTTFRISDWQRKDQNGNMRELHIENALKSIDFQDRTLARIAGVSNITDHNRKYPLVNRCPAFAVEELKLVESWRDSTQIAKGFHILTAVNAPIIVGNEKVKTRVGFGESCLIPACFGSYSIQLETTNGSTVNVIKTTL